MPTKTVYTKSAGKVILKDEDGSGWMTEGDWNNWKRFVRKKEHRRAKRHQLGYNAKALALIQGQTFEEAEKTGGGVYGAVKSAQNKKAKKKGFKKLQTQTTKLLHEHGGKMMVAAGAVATVIPVIGWVVGPAMQIGGAVLTKAQAARLAEKVAKKKQRELLAAKEKYEKGETTDEEYEEEAKGIIAGEIKNIYVQEQAQKRAKSVKNMPISQERKIAFVRGEFRDETAKIPITKIAIGSGVALSALVFVTALAVAKRRRR